MAQDVLITPASGIVEFKNDTVTDGSIHITAAGDLEISATGDILIGDASSDVYIGDGVNNVDIIFEQSGEIRGLTGTTITLGQSDSSVQMATTLNLNSNSISNISGMTVTGGTVDFNAGATVNFNKTTGTAPFTVDSTTVVANLNADLLDGQSGAYYLNWANVTNKPDPTLTINGDASGSATFTNLGNATLTLTISDDSHNHVIGNIDNLQTALDGKLSLTGGTLTGDLQIGNGTAQTNLLIQKADNNVSDHIIFYNGTTRVGEIGVQDTSWLRLNQVTNTNIYTPRYIRADAGLFVNDASTGIDTNGNLVGIGTASFNGVVTSTVAAGTAPFTIASNTKVANLNADYLDNYSSSSFFRENLGTIDSAAQNLDTYTTTGAYFINNWSEAGDVVQNAPAGSDSSGCLKVTQFNGATYVLQEYWPRNTDISWSRIRWAGTWTAWRESWGSGSDGAGSGLDADKLDGQEGSYYLNYNNFTNTPTIPTDTNDYVDSIAFNSASGVVTLGRTGSLADLTVDLDGRYLLTTGKAADSDKLDNLNSTDFVRYISTPGASSSNSLANQAWIVNYTDANNVDYIYYNEATNTFNFNADTAYNANTATAVVSANTFKENGTNLSGKYLGLTAKAADSDKLDNLDSTDFVRSNADDTISGDINLTAALSYTQTNPQAGIHVIRPQGALYSTNTSTLTGYLKITLPVSWTNTMMGMWIDIYDYAGDSNGESISLYVGGYNYSPTTSWKNCFAKVISSREDRNYNVRFGHDGTKCAIYVGESTTVWNYPQVSVRDFLGGYSGISTANWQDGWDVGFTTTLGTISRTVVAGLTADYALNADKLDGQQGSYYLNTSTNFGGDVSGAYNAIVVSNDSHNHSFLYERTNITFGASGVQWMDQSGTGGTGLDGATPRNPADAWYHNLLFNHANSAGYYSQISLGLNSDDMYFSRVANGTAQPFQRVFADNYHPNADKWTTARTLTLSGDVTGSVSFDGSGPINMTNTAVANDSHTHDGRYYTESEIQTFINRSYISSHSASSLAVGWYTIATVSSGRATAEFAIWDQAGGRHQSVKFIAAHNYGTDASNTITVLQNSYYSGNPFRYIRIKDLSTYDGAAIQVYIDDASNSVSVAITGSNVQSPGWVIKDWIADATDPGDVSTASNSTNGTTSAWASFVETTRVDLNQAAQGGLITTGEIYAGGDTSQQRVFHDGYHPNADKWTTARQLSLSGDASGSVTWDGSASAVLAVTVANDSHTHDTQYSRKLFQTSNTSATGNQYTKICRVTITSQYQDYSVTGYLHSAAEGGVDNAPERFDFSVKQQAAFGSNPLVYLRQYPTATSRVQLGYVIVQNTPSTIVDLYAKVTSTYTVIHGHSVTESELSRAGWLTNQTINTTEPSGITYRDSNKLFHDGYHPNADKWTTARTITLTGDVTGSASIDGSANISIATSGGSFDGTLTSDSGLILRTSTNAVGAPITFSDHAGGSYDQRGTLTFYHADTSANALGGAGSGYGSGFQFTNAGQAGNLIVKAEGDLVASGTIYANNNEALISGNVTGTLFADVISANQINADMIAANQITADLIAANSITANELEISSTASVANSIFFDGPNNRIDIKDASGNLRVRIGQL